MKIRCLYTSIEVGEAINEVINALNEDHDLCYVGGNDDMSPNTPMRYATDDVTLEYNNDSHRSPHFTWGAAIITTLTPEATLWLMANMPPNAEILEY